MYTTYDGAKKRATSLQAAMKRLALDVPLNQCQHAMARGAGYRDWDHLRRELTTKPRQVPLEGFQHRARVAMPEMATGPANRWLDVELGRLRDKGDPEATAKDEFRDWYVYVHEYAFAIGVMHYSTTTLLKGGRGMRLRQALVQDLATGRLNPAFDPHTFVLTSRGTAAELFGSQADHPGFTKAFNELVEARIFEVLGNVDGVMTVALHPPPVAVVQAHVDRCRASDSEYWRDPGHEGPDVAAP